MSSEDSGRVWVKIQNYMYVPKQGAKTFKYDSIEECETDVKLPYVLFGGEKKT